MKKLVMSAVIALASQASWAGNYECGLVNGHNIQIADGPALVVDGVYSALMLIKKGTFKRDYVSMDRQYVWSVRMFSTNLYNAQMELLARCSAPVYESRPQIEPYDPNNTYTDIARDGANPGGGFFP